MKWFYYVSRIEGRVLEIVRRNALNGAGGDVQALGKDSVWVDAPELLHGFQDAGWYKPVSREDAEAAASELSRTLPV